MVNIGPKKCRKAVKRALKVEWARPQMIALCDRCGMCPKLLAKQQATPALKLLGRAAIRRPLP